MVQKVKMVTKDLLEVKGYKEPKELLAKEARTAKMEAMVHKVCQV